MDPVLTGGPMDDETTLYFDDTGRVVPNRPHAVLPAVCAAIFDGDGRVLLERRSDDGFWGLPGGAVDVGELVEQAVKREVMEKTALRVEVKRLVGVYSDPRRNNIHTYPSGSMVNWVAIVFECVRVDGELRISGESTGIGYFHIDDLPEKTLLSHIIRISDATSSTAGPFIR